MSLSFSFSRTNSTSDEAVNNSSSRPTVLISSMEEDPKPEIPQSDDNLNFIFVPLAVFITIIFLSAMVYLMARTRRTFFTTLYKKVQIPADYTLMNASDIEDEDKDEDDDPTECLLAGKLQIENRYDSYQIHTYQSQRELFA